MSQSGRAFETKLNVLLGHLLSREMGVYATSEVILHRARPDVTIYINGVRVILEGSYSKSDAENDISERIEKGVGDIGIALFYKEAFPQNLADSELEEKLKNSTFEVRVIVPEDITGTMVMYLEGRQKVPKWITGWMEAKFRDLISIINEALQFIVGEEDVKQSLNKIEENIQDFARSVKSLDHNLSIAKNLYDLFYRLYGLSVGDYKEVAELIYAKAALTLLLSATFYQSVHATHRLPSLDELCRKYGAWLGLKKAFENMWKIDYRPIYGLALEVIQALPLSLGALANLVELAEEVSSKRNLLRRDFSGKVYHKIVGDWAVRKNFATYFTSIPAAYLLAYLAVFTRTGVFADYRKITVGDLACGSGTLLTATYNAIRDLYIRSTLEKGGVVDLNSFHKEMLEDSIWGIDALRYAVQIASTNLALQSPTTPVRRMNLFTVPLGVEYDDSSQNKKSASSKNKKKRVVLGSLEFIFATALPSVAMYFAKEPLLKFLEGAESASIIENNEVPQKLPEFDFIIMNPPFTRATGRGGKEKGGLFGFILDENAREDILEAYNKIRDGVGKILASWFKYNKNVEKRLREFLLNAGIKRGELFNIGQAGEGFLFLYLASQRVKKDGKIAFVLPKALLTGTSWFLARVLLFTKFHIEHIVVSYDSVNGYNFSESTNLSETLIVARRRDNPQENEQTTITVLLRKPSTSLEARALAFAILNTRDTYIEFKDAKAFTYKVSRKDLNRRLFNWGALLAFPDPELTRTSLENLEGKIFGAKIPITILGAIANVGIDRHQFHDAFQITHGDVPGSYPAVFGGEEERRLKMNVSPNARILPKDVKTKAGEKLGDRLFREYSSVLLVPDRIRVNTAHVISIYSTEPVLSNIFYSVRLKSNDEKNKNEKSNNEIKRLKALCLWLNTTWGILTILANRSETEGGWINLKMTHWRLQPVLDVVKLDDNIIDKLANIFDKYSDKQLTRLPNQFDPANIDPIRKSIDLEFLDAMGIKVKPEELDELYRRIHQNLKTWIGE